MTGLAHESEWAQWRNAIAEGRLHHAWLFAGRRGLGKGAFAMAAARELLGEAGFGSEAQHPDLIVVARAPKDDKEQKKREQGKPFELRRNIAVAQIREMQRKLTTRPTMGDRRVVLIDTADDLEAGASNALLKSLEEPPDGTIFMLIAHSPARLLPTIRSRCRVVRFQAMETQALAKLLREEMGDVDPALLDSATRAAHGSPGMARAFIAQNLAPIHDVMTAIIAQGDADFSARGKLAQLIGARPNRDRMAAILDMARTVVSAQAAAAQPATYRELADCHAQLVTLSEQVATYNFDPALLIVEIGSLLAALAQHKERAHV